MDVKMDPQARDAVEQIIAAGLGVRKAKTCPWHRNTHWPFLHLKQRPIWRCDSHFG